MHLTDEQLRTLIRLCTLRLSQCLIGRDADERTAVTHARTTLQAEIDRRQVAAIDRDCPPDYAGRCLKCGAWLNDYGQCTSACDF